MRREFRTAVRAATAAMVALVACGERPERPPNLLVLLSDTHRLDFTGYRPKDRSQLTRVAMALMNDGGSFEVQGHTDAQNSVEYNQGLSERRAGAVRDFLVAQGVSAGNLSAVGYSELRPIADNATAEGRAANRRVEIVRR